jgi:hypothetical protein
MSKSNKSTFPTLSSISSKFGFHRNTVSKWFAYPDAPKKGPHGYDFNEVSDWVKVCAERESTQSKSSPAMAQAKLSEVLERVRRLKVQNDIKEGLLIEKAQLQREVREMADAVQGVLYQLPGRCAVDLAGRTPAEIELRLTVAIDEAVMALTHGGGPEAQEWARQQIEARDKPND